MRIKIVYFESELEGECVMELLDSLDKFIYDIEYDKVKIYLNSPGGDLCYMNMLLDYVNHNKEKIDLVINGEVSSSVAHLCMVYQGRVSVLYGSCMMAHLPAHPGSRGINEKGTLNNFYHKDLESCKDDWLIVYNGLLTDKEITKMSKGYDVYIGYLRLVDFFISKENNNE